MATREHLSINDVRNWSNFGMTYLFLLSKWIAWIKKEIVKCIGHKLKGDGAVIGVWLSVAISYSLQVCMYVHRCKRAYNAYIFVIALMFN